MRQAGAVVQRLCLGDRLPVLDLGLVRVTQGKEGGSQYVPRWEREKLAREKGTAPWSYYGMQDDRPFFMAGLWAEAHDPATGEVADTYTLIITDVNAVMRVHDRMPV